MAIPINILKGTRSILKWFESANISMTDGFCHSVDLSINSLDLWDEFDPNVNKGDLTIKILIGSKTYEFMCEEREAPIEVDGTVFSVWGRSKQAWLDTPYAKTVKDTADTEHPWQSGDVKVSEIISHIITNYCYPDLSVIWNVEDFMVYEGTFSVDEQSPIAIISSLADIIGAKINAHTDGSLTIDAYSVEEETPVESYNDLDHIVSFTESNQYSQGYNAITVSGKGTDTSPQLQYEVIELSEDDRWEVGKARTVRVYYYHKDYSETDGVSLLSYTLSGITASLIGSGVKTTTEDVLLTWGSGSQTVFNQEGESDVVGDNDVPLEKRSVTYRTNYKDYSVTISTEEEVNAMFYFSDKSANVILSVEIGDVESKAQEEGCAALQLDLTLQEDDSTVADLKLYGLRSLVETGYDLIGTSIPVPSTPETEDVEEFLIFTDGEASLSKPYYSNLSYSFPGGTPHTLFVSVGSTQIGIENEETGEEYDPETDEVIPGFGAYVSYKTISYSYTVQIPDAFLNDPEKYDQYVVYFPTTCGDVISASVSLSVESDTDGCASLIAEFDSTDIGNVSFKIYGDFDLISKIYDSEGTTLSAPSSDTEKVEETITFSEGAGTLSKPFYAQMYSSETIQTNQNQTAVSIDYEDGDNKNKVVGVEYYTYYHIGYPNINEETDDYTIFIETTCGEVITISSNITTPEDDCSSVQIEVESDYVDGMKNVLGPNNDLQHRYFYFRYYGDPEKFSRAYSSIGAEVNLLFVSASYVGYPFDLKYKIDGYESITEQVGFTEGVGTLTWPCCSDFSDTLGGDSFAITNYDDEGSPPTPTCTLYSKNVTLSSGPDYQGVSKHLFANTTYFTTWINGYVQVPIEYDGEVTVYVETTCGDLLSVSTTVTSMENAVFRDVTINIKDYTSDVAVGDVEVYIDDVFRGTTDPFGNITLQDLQTGDHTLRFVASGYMASDEDELANDTFTVE
jgi:hypothetical protein